MCGYPCDSCDEPAQSQPPSPVCFAGTGTGVTGAGTGVCVSPEELVSAAIYGLMFGLLVDACC